MDKRIQDLYNSLHACPELSGHEDKTRAILCSFLEANTHLIVHDMGSWLYAVHHESAEYETIAFRADMDAVTSSCGTAFHGCGHDGHMTTVCALALAIDGEKVGKNIIFIFQHAEENGQGAKEIAPHLSSLHVSRIYGFHNIPGYPAGMPLLRQGTFACASVGMKISFTGRQAHAAYPETGANPAYAIAKTISFLENEIKSPVYEGMVLATIVHISAGEENSFGVSAGNGSVSVTIRAENEDDLHRLNLKAELEARMQGDKYGVTVDAEYFDAFPETRNTDAVYDLVKAKFDTEGIAYEILHSPMRWSEDFGHYLQVVNGLFIGIGAGREHSALHTDAYSYNTDIIDNTVKVLRTVIDC